MRILKERHQTENKVKKNIRKEHVFYKKILIFYKKNDHKKDLLKTKVLKINKKIDGNF